MPSTTASDSCRPDRPSPPTPFPYSPPLAGSLDISATLAVSGPPLYDFLFDLVVDPDCDCLPFRCDAWPGDGQFRFGRADLDAHAHQWAADENLSWPDRATLLISLDNLPWRNDQIVFYWGDSDETDESKNQ